MKRILALLSVVMILSATSALACGGNGKTKVDGSKPTSVKQI